MFGLSWGQISIIVLVAVFVLGPERIPTAVTFLVGTLRSARTMVDGTKAGLLREIGPELEELRRQVADLQSLKDIQELRDQRDLSPSVRSTISPSAKGVLGTNDSQGDPREAVPIRQVLITGTQPVGVR